MSHTKKLEWAYLAWIKSHGRVYPQLWGGDYTTMEARLSTTVAKHALTEEDQNKSLDYLAKKYPAPESDNAS